MKNIQSIALGLTKKPNKNQAFSAVRTLIEEAGPDSPQARELATLYAHFLPSVPKMAKNDLQWVSKAVPKKDVRYYLNYLHESSGMLVGTDGNRVHWIETEQDRGYLAPMTGDVVECNGTYPDIRRVIPSLSPSHILRVSELEKKVVEFGSKIVKQYAFPNGSTFNAKYVDDAVNGADEFLWNPQAKKMEAINISSMDSIRNAVIMPMRD
jgi:hypothetical protein